MDFHSIGPETPDERTSPAPVPTGWKTDAYPPQAACASPARDAAGFAPPRPPVPRQEARASGQPVLPGNQNVFVLKRQFDLVDNEDRRTALAKGMVAGRLSGMVRVLRGISCERGVREAGVLAQEVRGWAVLARNAHGLAALRGVADEARARYFLCLSRGFREPCGFRRRDRSFSADPVNVTLSLLYLLLVNRSCAALRSAGLDPRPGILHDMDNVNPSLAMDLAEEFKPALADSLALALFNGKHLDASQFGPCGQGEFPLWGATPQCMRPDGLRRLVRAFEREIEAPERVLTGEGAMSFAQALSAQAAQLRRAVAEDVRAFTPLSLP